MDIGWGISMKFGIILLLCLAWCTIEARQALAQVTCDTPPCCEKPPCDKDPVLPSDPMNPAVPDECKGRQGEELKRCVNAFCIVPFAGRRESTYCQSTNLKKVYAQLPTTPDPKKDKAEP